MLRITAKDGLPPGKFAIGGYITEPGTNLETAELLTRSPIDDYQEPILFGTEGEAHAYLRVYLCQMSEVGGLDLTSLGLFVLHRRPDGQLVRLPA
jgi:hypothetical protein